MANPKFGNRLERFIQVVQLSLKPAQNILNEQKTLFWYPGAFNDSSLPSIGFQVPNMTFSACLHNGSFPILCRSVRIFTKITRFLQRLK